MNSGLIGRVSNTDNACNLYRFFRSTYQPAVAEGLTWWPLNRNVAGSNPPTVGWLSYLTALCWPHHLPESGVYRCFINNLLSWMSCGPLGVAVHLACQWNNIGGYKSAEVDGICYLSGPSRQTSTKVLSHKQKAWLTFIYGSLLGISDCQFPVGCTPRQSNVAVRMKHK